MIGSGYREDRGGGGVCYVCVLGDRKFKEMLSEVVIFYYKSW